MAESMARVLLFLLLVPWLLGSCNWLQRGQSGEYTLALSPQEARLVPGGEVRVEVRLERRGFGGEVALSLEGPQGLLGEGPGRVAFRFEPNPVREDRAVLVLRAGGEVRAGEYSLTVRGRAQGQPERTASLRLRVEVQQGAGAVRVAILVGAGVWKRPLPGAGKVFRKTL